MGIWWLFCIKHRLTADVSCAVDKWVLTHTKTKAAPLTKLFYHFQIIAQVFQDICFFLFQLIYLVYRTRHRYSNSFDQILIQFWSHLASEKNSILLFVFVLNIWVGSGLSLNRQSLWNVSQFSGVKTGRTCSFISTRTEYEWMFFALHII